MPRKAPERPAPPVVAAEVHALEPRRMLSGNVTVTLVDGVLKIEGDGADNVLEVIAERTVTSSLHNGSGSRTVYETTLRFVSDGGTTVNGLPADEVTIRIGEGADFSGSGLNGFPSSSSPPQVRDLDVRLGHGDDALTLDFGDGFSPGVSLGPQFGLEVTGRALIRAGGGDDAVFVRGLRAADVLVLGQGGGDSLAMAGFDAGRVRVIGGEGGDRVTLSGVASGAVEVHGRGGDDAVRTDPSTEARHLVAYLGGGDDLAELAGRFTHVSVRSQAGDDDITLTADASAAASRTTVLLGGGDDRLALAKPESIVVMVPEAGAGRPEPGDFLLFGSGAASLAGRVTLSGGGGDDVFELGEPFSGGAASFGEGPAVIAGGEGRDQIDVPDELLDSLAESLVEGVDVLMGVEDFRVTRRPVVG